jgi:hypothetical protein
MHFEGDAARWWQSVESTLATASWDTFCAELHSRFDRDQHELLTRQLFHLRQTSTVSDYVSKFTGLMDGLRSYSTTVDPVYYVTRFIDGLRPDIKAIVIVQRPKTLDAACVLALLQEEAGGAVPSVRPMQVSTPKPAFKNAHPLPSPPPKQDKAVIGPAAPEPTTGNASALAALKSYRRALGLCYKCAAKWSKDHKCAPEVLHAVHDLWESLLSADTEVPVPTPPNADAPEQLFLALSKAAVSGAPASRTVQFDGYMEHVPVHILVDSGSSSSFLSEDVAKQLSTQTLVAIHSSVQVAGGGLLTSFGILHNLSWTVQGVSFCSSFRVLPLKAYDVILGMDSLEHHSPM